MFATVTKTRSPLDQPLEFATLAGEEMVPWLSQIEGWKGLLMLTDETDMTTLVISLWESREVAEEHRAARTRFRERITTTVNVEVEDVTDYEVTFCDLTRITDRR